MCSLDQRKVDLIQNTSCFNPVLDIACGNNHYKPFFKRHVGLDLRNRKADVLADAHSLPFRSNIFKTLILFDIVEHSTNYGLILSEAARVAVNRATYLLSTIYIEGDAVEGDMEHVHCYTPELLKRALKRHGFKPKIKRDRDILYAVGKIVKTK
ncbi:MAG: hypothetical protein DRJ03_08160 [Chloroflexi bacterium]|nr:MAG: hypothetical protein DRJ03_08160 [Chloroflexota bacterium]